MKNRTKATVHHKRYHEAVEASKKKLERIEKRISAKYHEATDGSRKHYSNVQKRAYAKLERAERPFQLKYEATLKPVKEEVKQVVEAAEAIRMRALRKARRDHSKVRKEALKKFADATGSFWV
jgi:hypothetical protein